MSSNFLKIFATFLSWAIMLTIVAILVGTILYIIESVRFAQTGLTTSEFVKLISDLFSISNGLGVLTIGIIITASFSMVTIFIVLLKSGQKFLLKIITQVEE